MRYPVTLTKDDNDTYLVRFPDVPEAITFGDTKKEALERGLDALLTAFDAYMKERREIPAPSARRGYAVEVPALEMSKIALYKAMRERSVNKSELARRLHWHLPQVDRVLNVRHGSQIDQLEAAFAAVGKRLVVDVVDAEPTRHSGGFKDKLRHLESFVKRTQATAASARRTAAKYAHDEIPDVVSSRSIGRKRASTPRRVAIAAKKR